MSEDRTYTYNLDVPEFDKAPARVISLVPSVTESLFDLALGDRVIAITDYCIHPADKVAKLPRIGGTRNPDIQKIISMGPDLVIANQEENRKEDIDALQSAGLTVWITFPKAVPDVFNLLWDMMNLFESTEMVPRIRLIEQTYDWVQGISRVNEDDPVTVFVPIWNDPLMTINSETYMHDLLQVCGGINVFAQRQRQFPLEADLGQAEPFPDDDPRVIGRDRRYPRISLQEVIDAQPEVVILPDEPFKFTDEHRQIFAALDIPAAHNEKIFLIDGTLLSWHGTRIAYALDSLPALFTRDDL